MAAAGGAFFVVNPAAGQGRGRRAFERVRGLLGAQTDWDVATTSGPGDAADLARRAARDGWRRVVAIGGDGTLSEVAGGLMGTGADLGIVPAGTANDFARCVGIPVDPAASVQLALDGAPRAIDVGEVRSDGTSRYYLGIAGIGFDAEAAARVWAPLGRLGSRVPYLASVAITLAVFRPVTVDMLLDGRPLRSRVLAVAVANTRAYGGGMLIAPGAREDDGLLDLCIVGDLSAVDVIRLVPKVYSGQHGVDPRVSFLRCREVEVRSPDSVRCHADGEPAGRLPARFSLHAGALRCVTGTA